MLARRRRASASCWPRSLNAAYASSAGRGGNSKASVPCGTHPGLVARFSCGHAAREPVCGRSRIEHPEGTLARRARHASRQRPGRFRRPISWDADHNVCSEGKNEAGAESPERGGTGYPTGSDAGGPRGLAPRPENMVAKNPEGVCDLTHGSAYASATDVCVWKIYKSQPRGVTRRAEKAARKDFRKPMGA